jgi:hypothetical protein
MPNPCTPSIKGGERKRLLLSARWLVSVTSVKSVASPLQQLKRPGWGGGYPQNAPAKVEREMVGTAQADRAPRHARCRYSRFVCWRRWPVCCNPVHSANLWRGRITWTKAHACVDALQDLVRSERCRLSCSSVCVRCLRLRGDNTCWTTEELRRTPEVTHRTSTCNRGRAISAHSGCQSADFGGVTEISSANGSDSGLLC